MTKEEQDLIDKNHASDLLQVVDGLAYPYFEVAGHYKMPSFTEKDVVVDIGANIGNFCLAACMKGARNVIAYEPSLKAYTEALKNIEEHGYSEYVKLYHLAVWKSDIKEELRYNSGEEGHQTLITSSKGDVIIDTIGLDDILKQYGVVDFLKLDCEYAEFAIIFSSTMLSTHVKNISCEVHRINDIDNSPEELEDFIKEQGFEVEHLYTGDKNISFLYAFNKNL